MKANIKEMEINGEIYVKKSEVNGIEQPKGDYVVVRTYSPGDRDWETVN